MSGVPGRLQRASARRLGHEGSLTGGAVCLWQYFGSSLQLTPHLHLLVPEARLAELGVALPSRLLPPPTAPPQLVLDVV